MELGGQVAVQLGDDLQMGCAFDQLADNVGIQEIHINSAKLNLPVRRWNPPSGANLLQGGKKRIVVVKSIGDGGRNRDRNCRRQVRKRDPQSRLHDFAQGLSLLARLPLGLAQQSFVNVHGRLHRTNVERSRQAVNLLQRRSRDHAGDRKPNHRGTVDAEESAIPLLRGFGKTIAAKSF